MSTNCACLQSSATEVPYSGNPAADIFIVGESPGKNEIRIGKPFVGEAGKLLKGSVEKAGLHFSTFFVANSARCLINKDALSASDIRSVLSACRPKLERAIHYVGPRVIVPLGDIALRQILKKSGITKHRGRWVWSDEFKCWVMPAFHPAYCLRNKEMEPYLVDDFRKIRDLKDRGWEMFEEEAALDYRSVDSIRPLLNYLEENEGLQIAIDSESTGLDTWDRNSIIIGYSISFKAATGLWIPLFEEVGDQEEAWFEVTQSRVPEGKIKGVPTIIRLGPVGEVVRKVRELWDLLNSDKCKLYLMNVNHDRAVFRKLFTEFDLPEPSYAGFRMDVQSAAHVLNETLFRMASLEDLQFHFTDFASEYSREFSLYHSYGDMMRVPLEDMVKYACGDADATRRVAISIRSRLLQRDNLRSANYYAKLVHPTLSTLYEMERNGSLIDLERIPTVKEETAQKIAEQEEAALRAAPQAVKIKHRQRGLRLSRSDFVRDVIYSREGFNTPIKSTTKSGAPSMDKHVRKDILESGRASARLRTFIEAYNEWSELNTLHSRYLKGFEKAVKSDNRIHSKYSLVAAATGRVASRDPNMMNNPKRSESAKIIRRLLIAPEGKVLLAIDQGQAELRWAAHLSNDPEMIRVFKSGEDIHTNTALALAGKSRSDLTDTEFSIARRNAKCFHPDTEVLTKQGWVSMRNLRPDTEIIQAVVRHDKIQLEWVLPDIEIRPNHKDTLVYLHNEGMDITVTPDHRMLGQDDRGVFRVTTPYKINSMRYWWNAGILEEGEESPHDLLRFMISVQADGSWYGVKRGNPAVRFSFRRVRKTERLRSLLNRLGIRYKESVKGSINSFYVYPCAETREVFKILGPDKELPWGLLLLSPDCRGVIIDESQYWDGCQMTNWRSFRVSSVKLQNLDVLQALSSVTMRKSKISVSDYCSSVSISEKCRSRGGNLSLDEFPYTEDVALLSVPSTFVLARSSGKRRVPVIIGQTINFGVLYMMSPPGFVRYAKQDYGIVISEKEAERWINTFFERYPGLRRYHRETIDFCKESGYVESPLGRRRHLPEINSSERSVRSAAERQAVNHPIQSASSDTVLLAINEILADRALPDGCTLVNFIHDEVVFEIPEDVETVRRAYRIIKHYMENPKLSRFGVQLRVPLVSDGKVGRDLASMTDVSSYTGTDKVRRIRT